MVFHKMYAQKRDHDKFEFIEARDIRRRAKFIGTVDGYEGEYQKTVKAH